jgi:tripartite-type tricarboxylate transporter receptor subunit TctC
VTRFHAALSAFAAIVIAWATATAHAQEYPTRPIRMIVPFSPGGSTDLTARLVAREAEKQLGKPIIIDNKPGAAAMIGLNELVGSRPDGYTIGMTNSGMVTQSLYGVARYNYATDLQAIVQVGEVPFVFAVKAGAPWKSVEDFVVYARANPGAIKYGITGFGNTSHLGPEQFGLLAKIKMEPVNFDGGSPLIAEIGSNSSTAMRQTCRYSYFNASTGFMRAARTAGTVPKAMPTAQETRIAMTADNQETCSR